MGALPPNFSTMSAKNQQEWLKANDIQDATNQQNAPVEKDTTKKSLGYVEGYSRYISKSGGLITDDGNNPYRQEEVIKDDIEAEVPKPSPISKQINKQINKFRNIFGYSDTQRQSDSLEDPTFLIFDLHLDYGQSPLFNNVPTFFGEYSDSMEELSERLPLYNEFVSMISKIFPGDINEFSGSKRHYINSIAGMDNLFKKIVDYPNDALTFTLSEDITLLAQYLSELYSNLVYSYDTHRYMIPDNLLRFNMTIFFRDVREMKVVSYDKDHNFVSDDINDRMSKFAYVLHDCQFDFFNSRSFADGMTVSGFEGGASTTPNILSFNINYKSYSKITMPDLIDDSTLIDLRERQGLDDGNYDRYNNDYVSKTELVENTESNSVSETTNDRISSVNRHIKPEVQKRPLAELGERLKNSFTDEISDVRNVLVNKVKEEVTVLSSQVQRAASDALFDTFGFEIPGVNGITLSKVNVYYDDPFQAINKVSFLFEKFLDQAVDDLKDNVRVEYDKEAEKGNKVNIYWDETGETFGEKAGSAALNAFFGPTGVIPRDSNVYSDALSEGKTPTGDSRHDDGKYNEKYPEGDVSEDGTYNEKYPEGDVNDDGTYNEKYPDGDRHEDGTYNEKHPDGDLHEDGTYNEKEPLGSVQDKGSYNEKYPDGDRHEDGDYNEKYPEGDVHPDGQYNEKEPLGSVQDKGEYNEKYPEGDRHEDGTYNEKYPEGDVQPDGDYNEKYPEGDVHEDGTYNDKEPKGDVYSDDELEDGTKKPSGNVYGKKEEKEAESPEGDVHPDGQYNEKYPKGNLYKKDDDK
jgi:hypothetical protein